MITVVIADAVERGRLHEVCGGQIRPTRAPEKEIHVVCMVCGSDVGDGGHVAETSVSQWVHAGVVCGCSFTHEGVSHIGKKVVEYHGCVL